MKWKAVTLLAILLLASGSAAAKPLDVTIKEFFGAEYEPLRSADNVEAGETNIIRHKAGGGMFDISDGYNYPGQDTSFEHTFQLSEADDYCADSLISNGMTVNVWLEGPNTGEYETKKEVYISCDGWQSVEKTVEIDFTLPDEEGDHTYDLYAGQSWDGSLTYGGGSWETQLDSATVELDVNDLIAAIEGPDEATMGDTVDFEFDSDEGSFGYLGPEDSEWRVDGNVEKTGDYEDFSYTFDEEGTYEIELWMYDDVVGEDTDTHTIRVEPEELEFDLECPSSVEVGETLNADADHVDGQGDVDLEWDVGGQRYSGESISHSVSDSGSLYIDVEAEDEAGQRESKSCSVNVEVNKPSADISIDKPGDTVEEGDTINIQSSSDSGSLPISQTEWTINGERRTGSSISYTPEQSGTLSIELTVSDAEGNSDSASQTIDVAKNYAKPTVKLARPERATVNETVQFDAAQSTAPAGIQSVEWTIAGQTYTGTTVSTTFSQTGTYNVRATVTDQQGQETSASTNIQIVTEETDDTSEVVEGGGGGGAGIGTFFENLVDGIVGFFTE